MDTLVAASEAAVRTRRARHIDASIGCAEALADDGHDMLALTAYREAMQALIQECHSDRATAWVRRQHAPILRMVLLLERRRMRDEALRWIDLWRECNDGKGIPRTEAALLMGLEAWMRAGFTAPYPAAISPQNAR